LGFIRICETTAADVRRGLGKEIDQVPVGVAKEHGAASPRLISRLHHELAHEVLEARPLEIDVLDLEFNNDRLIGGGYGGTSVEEINSSFAADRERSSGSFQFNVVFDSNRIETGDGRVKLRQSADVIRHESCGSQFHISYEKTVIRPDL
jgi:hypothetical protein